MGLYIHTPDNVLTDRALLDGAKLLYGLLYALYHTKRKPVRSENTWFAERLGKEERQIRRYLKSLKEQGHIKIIYQRVNKTQVKRLITPLSSKGLKSPVEKSI
jgi:DNA-binding Lrp family transcriptional regulator